MLCNYLFLLTVLMSLRLAFTASTLSIKIAFFAAMFFLSVALFACPPFCIFLSERRV